MQPAGEAAVSPVIGTILVLAITVLGIAALLVWGGPTLERVQGQNAQAAMQGEFEGLRDASQELSVPDHSRFPSVSMPRGELGIETGTRFMVTANHDAANPNCNLHITGWGGSTATSQVTVQATGCRALNSTSFEVNSVSGTTISKVAASVSGGTVTAGGANFAQGDWVFRITDGRANPTTFAQAWLHSSDRLTWKLASATGERSLALEGGAIFSTQSGTTFLAKAPPIGDQAFGVGYYGLWLRTYAAVGLGGVDQPGSHQVFLALASNDLEVDNATASSVRYDFSGSLAEAWCKALVPQRNPYLTGAAYTEDPAAPCTTGNAQGLRSVTFAYTAGTRFQFRFLHARIQASIVL